MNNIDQKLTLGTASEFVDPSRQVKLLPDAHTRIQAYEELRGGVLATLPEFWPAIEIGIAAMATLLISTNSQPTAIIFEDGILVEARAHQDAVLRILAMIREAKRGVRL